MRRGRIPYKRDRDLLDLERSPAEQLVEEGAPNSMKIDHLIGETRRVVRSDDLEGEVLRPWEPKGEEALGAPPAVTIEGENLEFSPEPPQTAGGSPPNHKNSFARWSRDE